MAQENLKTVRSLYEAGNAGEWERVLRLAHPDVEWIPDSRVGEGPFRGAEAVVHFFRDRGEMFTDLRMQVERLFEKDDEVLAFIRITGRGKGSGAPFEIEVAHLLTLRDGVVMQGRGYANRAEALEAVGLSE